MSFKSRRKFIQKVRDQERRRAENLSLKRFNILATELNKAHSREVELLKKGFKAKTKRIDRLQENLSNVIMEEENVLSEIRTQHETVKRCAKELKSMIKNNNISLAVISDVEYDGDVAHSHARKAG